MFMQPAIKVYGDGQALKVNDQNALLDPFSIILLGMPEAPGLFSVHTCGALAKQRPAHAVVVQGQNLQVIGGPGLQVLQLIRGDVANRHFQGLVGT